MLALVAILAAQAAGPPIDEPSVDGEVVVVARPLKDLASDWQACIDRGCPPKVEMDRAMAYAEAQLSAGDYGGSWRTLRTTKQRNMKHAEGLPLDVARIARATSRMADLNGEPPVARYNATETVAALRAGLTSADGRILLAKLDIGDAYVPERKFDFALAQYARVSREAKQKGLMPLVAEAEYRRAALLVGLSQDEPKYRSSARRALDGIITSGEPAMQGYRDMARLTAINLLPEKKQQAAMLAVIPTLAPTSADKLLLVWAPPIDFEKLVVTPPARNAPQQWLDVRYRIAADGSVHDVAPARQAPHLDPVLRDAAVQSLGERRYARVAIAADDTGPVRYARYTFVLDTAPAKVGFRIPGKAKRPRADVFDLGTQLARRD